MNNLRTLLLLLLFRCVLLSQNQVVLKPWVQVYGTDNNEQLGVYVNSIKPTTHFPYNVSASTTSLSNLYMLHTTSDTATKSIFWGQNVMTGDINGDGYEDVVLSKTSTDLYDTVYIYWGTATGVDTLNPLKIPGKKQLAGLRAKCVCDINNDGKPD